MLRTEKPVEVPSPARGSTPVARSPRASCAWRAAVPRARRESQDLVRSVAYAACCSKTSICSKPVRMRVVACSWCCCTCCCHCKCCGSCLLSFQLLFQLLHLRTPAVPLLEHWCSITVLLSQEGCDLQQLFSAVAGHLVVEPPLDLFNLLHVTYLCTPRSQMWPGRWHGSVTTFSITPCAKSAHDISHFHERRLPVHFLVLSALPIPSLGPHRGTLDLALMLCLFLTLSSLSSRIFMCLSRSPFLLVLFFGLH